jgi:hypothetical protein
MDPEILKGIIDGTATIIGAFIVGFFGTIIQRKYSRERDRQDKESQWRQHAIELTKLDLERKIKDWEMSKNYKPLRPSILDFLANYRDLQELGDKSPTQLNEDIINKRISKRDEQEKNDEHKK